MITIHPASENRNWFSHQTWSEAIWTLSRSIIHILGKFDIGTRRLSVQQHVLQTWRRGCCWTCTCTKLAVEFKLLVWRSTMTTTASWTRATGMTANVCTAPSSVMQFWVNGIALELGWVVLYWNKLFNQSKTAFFSVESREIEMYACNHHINPTKFSLIVELSNLIRIYNKYEILKGRRIPSLTLITDPHYISLIMTCLTIYWQLRSQNLEVYVTSFIKKIFSSTSTFILRGSSSCINTTSAAKISIRNELLQHFWQSRKHKLSGI